MSAADRGRPGPAIPRGTPPFEGSIARLYQDSTPRRLLAPEPPRGPNILLVMLDDVGFGSCSTFGGPVATPALERVAAMGLRYNQFHTTALCSPTRAALLTGRNHHTVHMGGIPENANSFPGYDSAIPREAATIAEVLRQSGFSTGCFGKWHLTPSWEQSPAGPFDRWPTGMGFERFYGILGAEASQWEPAVYDQATPVEPYVGRDHYHLTEDLADRAIEWLQRQRASAPDRPFFCYFAPSAVHAPHHVAPEWWQRYRGRFDGGWDALREEIYRRQLDLRVIPPGTTLTPRPAQIPAWDEYPDRYRPVASRLMEVFAGFLEHTDAQVGRVLDAIEALGCLEDTLVIYLTGDNGASAEGTLHGAWSAPSFQNGVPEDPEWLLEHLDDFGTPRCENHFNVGWAWALDSPFQWMKQVASHFGGTRNGLVVSWPRGIGNRGGLRPQFHHVIDIAATILEVTGIEAPERVNGIPQMPIDGVSMAYSFEGPEAPSTHETQYFEILGNRSIYHDGWMASCFHGRLPWVRFAGFEFDGEQETWELYHVAEDFSQGHNLAAAHPERLVQLRALFEREAAERGVFPLRDPSGQLGGEYSVPRSLGDRSAMTYTRAHDRMPEASVVNLKNASHAITAEVVIPPRGPGDDPCSGVIACQGGNMAGWSLYLDDRGVPVYLYNWFGHELTFVRGSAELPPGPHTVRLYYAHDRGLGAGGLATLEVDGLPVAQERIEHTVPVVYSMSGETFDVGRDTGSPVGPYPHGFPFGGEIVGVTLERVSAKDKATRDAEEQGRFQAGLRAH